MEQIWSEGWDCKWNQGKSIFFGYMIGHRRVRIRRFGHEHFQKDHLDAASIERGE
jgi:hypothetical protein